MLDDSVRLVGTDLEKVFRYRLAESHASGAALEEVACQRGVEEMRLMGDHIVKYGDHLAALLHLSCYVSQRRREIRHPVSDDKHIRIPVADLPVCAVVCKRIGRIQQRYALHRYGLIVCCHKLCLSRKKELRILPLEVERSDNMCFAQFTIKACVKLRDSSSIGVETGQYCYFQLLLAFLVLCLDVLLVESCKNSLSDVKVCISCDYRGSA